jgi:hypothetical protein
MKNMAIQSALAACLLAPVMAFAVTTDSFSDSADKTVHIVGFGALTVQASWTDLLAKYTRGPAEQYQATSLLWTLTDNNDVVMRSGSFNDLANDGNKGTIVLDETGLSKGKYTLTLNGQWNVGAHNWDVKKDVNVSLGKSSFSPVSPVPEPESYALLLAGLGLMGTIALRRNAKNS